MRLRALVPVLSSALLAPLAGCGPRGCGARAGTSVPMVSETGDYIGGGATGCSPPRTAASP